MILPLDGHIEMTVTQANSHEAAASSTSISSKPNSSEASVFHIISMTIGIQELLASREGWLIIYTELNTENEQKSDSDSKIIKKMLHGNCSWLSFRSFPGTILARSCSCN